ncbi:hypothetical protein A2X44_05055 [candidate division CPR3 bacterium GWF2_35_18]|uniref:PHP domain protein n=1 Tax=candidate division CPR3 bacterium GW2011_GWF2_35_18 TaxID=1618350 RepID=A0A0G0E3F1_UNCC3|nr:MAG: PHP domain protein [candidate division CPR3 bacterium GW2011_GWF2_35_18]KKP87254.1 MAG: PHP domain protein [candidate division CPR3 bacterium GW2011_GWE2_35_7]OGB63699.1 MAG: hypothetical protein A2X44_05055 [candidate division CPR3 bacterium GWF2_35_18]OGB64981.1 MAG: hypothetical protein A2250_00990 [candidate division CPR3 bacterium RIFOXYA2_FULL_35_13]OGB76872.1 MAG: hypothetical protein A2476_04760 [candidate division CPR3 bacterium RIFOXYC2_FULL_35_7]OGB78536.1 MAG: hypothetical 
MEKRYIADLHLHSKYSRAVSKDMNIPVMWLWGNKKGINLIGTGDFTHPFWIHDLKQDLEAMGNGFYKYKGDQEGKGPFFVLSSEISCIYSQGGKTRKIHIVFLSPSIEVAELINKSLSEIGNITSDGRPILGISALNLVKKIKAISSEVIVIPAHIWTPWFSLFGANSGFDSIAECFGDVSQDIIAVETGLSSDPAMNWRIPELDNRQIVSSSDAHSPAKLGREATVFESDFSYTGLKSALSGKSAENKILYTIEFFPEEGKYHYTGHRNCGVKYNLEDLRKKGKICPVCGKQLTVGVMQRVEDLGKILESDLQIEDWYLGENKVRGIKSGKLKRPPYVMLVPLIEIISEALEVGGSSKAVTEEYEKIINGIGTEFKVLLTASELELKVYAQEKVVEGILKLRKREISVDPGFDGVFGKVKIWGKEKPEEIQEQITLF